jgi:hypothetical protein
MIKTNKNLSADLSISRIILKDCEHHKLIFRLELESFVKAHMREAQFLTILCFNRCGLIFIFIYHNT